MYDVVFQDDVSFVPNHVRTRACSTDDKLHVPKVKSVLKILLCDELQRGTLLN